MRLVYVDNFRLGVALGDEFVDVSEIVSAQNLPIYPQEAGFAPIRPADLGAIVREWAHFGPLLAEAARTGKRQPLSSVRLRHPVPRPVNIDCMALNYIEDGSGKPHAPINAFHKTPNSLIGPGEAMVLPDVPGTVFEGEAELAIVIGKRGHRIPAARAMEYVFGYTNLIEGSVRGLGPERNNFYQMKSRDTFCCIGPSLVTADEIADPHNLQVRLWNNGKLMQDFNTRDMAYPIRRCIEFISSTHTLEPGDIIATGTNHQGLHPFADGDCIELEVEGLGRLHMNVSDELQRSWKLETRAQRQKAGLDPIAVQMSGKYAKGA